MLDQIENLKNYDFIFRHNGYTFIQQNCDYKHSSYVIERKNLDQMSAHKMK